MISAYPLDVNDISLADEIFYTDIDPVLKEDVLLGYEEVHNADAVRNSLINIFTINKLELPGKPDFGNPLRLSLFDLFDYFDEQTLISAITNEIEKYEPRILLTNINIQKLPEYNRIMINIEYQMLVASKITTDILSIPFSHNSLSFLGGRNTSARVPTTPPGSCGQTSMGLI